MCLSHPGGTSLEQFIFQPFPIAMSRKLWFAGAVFFFGTPFLYAQNSQMSAGPAAPQAIAASATTESISYQGSLTDGGSPANGTYDFEFKLFDAVSGGSQLGSTYVAEDVSVADGVFSVAVDLGTPVFWEGDQFLQVGARPGASGSSFTAIGTPAQVLATPLALALPGVFVDQAAPFLGIGRANRITTAEVFGVNAPATSGFGGMYLSTDGSAGQPFYGYAPGGSIAAYHYLDGSDDKWKLYNGGTRLTVQNDGKVGIGTSSPSTLLHLDGTNADLTIGDPTAEHMLLEGNIGSGSIIRLYDANDDEMIRINSHGSNNVGEMLFLSPTGQTRIELDAAVDGGGFAQFRNSGNNQTVQISAEEVPGQGATLKLSNSAGTTTIELDADYGSGNGNPGRILTDELELNGSDLAEKFDVNASPATLVKPGMLVSIDPDDPGALTVSHVEYDPKVVGIVSGAGGIRTGIYMGQEGTLADGEYPIAIAGRVYVNATTEGGIIEPGDLLTTSSRPGYAIKAADTSRTKGAIVGKAMTGLDAGEGLVLLFVSLQ